MLPLLGICFLIGVFARWVWRFPPQTTHVLNRLILSVTLPALVLKTLHGLAFDRSLVLAASMMWLVFAGAWVIFGVLGGGSTSPHNGSSHHERAGALTLTSGLANTAFLGIPMIQGLLGEAAVGPALVVDQLGSFLLLSSFGLFVATRSAPGGINHLAFLRRVVLFPPLIALVVALITTRVFFSPSVMDVLSRLGSMTTPLALISVGFQLELGDLKGRVRPLALGLFYRLILSPLVVLGVFTLLGGRGLLREVVVLQAGMAPMVTAGILAVENDLEPPLATLMLGVGIPLSFITIPLWAMALARL